MTMIEGEYITEHRRRIKTVLEQQAQLGKPIDHVRKVLGRAPYTIKKYCREWGIALGDYKPFARRAKNGG